MRLSHCLSVLLALACLPAAAATPQIILDFNGSLTLEVAASSAQRSKGLSGRREVPAGTGMLFMRYQQRSFRSCFWMKDTAVSLDAAFIAADGTILQIVTMQPNSAQLHCPPASVTWVIETPADWFATAGITAAMNVGHGNLARMRALQL